MIVWLIFALACDAPSAPERSGAAASGPPPMSWVDDRITEAETRLQKAPAGRLLRKAIDAHGGLRPWYASGTVAFDFSDLPAGKPDQRRYTRSRVDL